MTCFKFRFWYRRRRWLPAQVGSSQEKHCKDGHLARSKRKETGKVVELASYPMDGNKIASMASLSLKYRRIVLPERNASAGRRFTLPNQIPPPTGHSTLIATPSRERGWMLHRRHRKVAPARPCRSTEATSDKPAMATERQAYRIAQLCRYRFRSDHPAKVAPVAAR